jgi:F-type H+-transporting ATPase subunit a
MVADVLFGLEFPPISHLLVWPSFLPFGFNKIALISVLAVLLTALLFILASRGDATAAPRGVKNVAESSIDFVQNGIIMQTMGRDGLGWTPLFLSMFFFIFLTNITGIIPTFQMPANARMAGPLVLSLLVWLCFNIAGMKHQGVGGYFKSTLFPPGVPKALYVLVTPIEFISVFLVRPFSLAVRLFANLLAGHILLVTFAVLANALFTAQTMQAFLKPMGVLPFIMLILLTGFEVLVAFLQAYIFVILAAVYIGGAVHPEH